MSGHTPGPWSLETVPTTAGSCHKIGPFPSMGVRPQVHACVYADGIRIGLDEKSPVAAELLANARLMAAAPELLENLIGCMEALASHVPDCIEVQCARAAIARATQPLPPTNEE